MAKHLHLPRSSLLNVCTHIFTHTHSHTHKHTLKIKAEKHKMLIFQPSEFVRNQNLLHSISAFVRGLEEPSQCSLSQTNRGKMREAFCFGVVITLLSPVSTSKHLSPRFSMTETVTRYFFYKKLVYKKHGDTEAKILRTWSALSLQPKETGQLLI